MTEVSFEEEPESQENQEEREAFKRDIFDISEEQAVEPLAEDLFLLAGTDEIPTRSDQIPEYTFRQEQGGGVLIRFDGTEAPTEILVDGRAVPEGETDVFLAKTGRVHVAIFRGYLDQLTVGDHTVTLECPDGQREAVLHIEATTITRTEPVVLNVDFECKVGNPVTIETTNNLYYNGEGEAVKLSWEEEGLFTQYFYDTMLISYDSVNIIEGKVQKAIRVKDDSEEDQFIGIGDDVVATEWSSDYPSSTVKADKFYSLTLVISGASSLDPNFDNFIIDAPGSVAAHAQRGADGYDMVFVTVYYRPVSDAPSLTVTDQDSTDGIELLWNGIEQAAGYRIYAVSGSQETLLASVAEPVYHDGRKLSMGETYSYRISVLDENGTEITAGTHDDFFNPFHDDLADDDPRLTYVAWAYNNEIVKGTGRTTFGPDDPTSRMNFVMILYKMHGSPKVSGKNPFKDVSGSKSVKAALWAYNKGLVKGTDKTHFSPDLNLSRINIIMILYKLAGSPKVSGSNLFEDISGSKTIKAVTWAVKKGIISGVDATHFDPDGACSRALFVEVLCKYNEIHKVFK